MYKYLLFIFIHFQLNSQVKINNWNIASATIGFDKKFMLYNEFQYRTKERITNFDLSSVRVAFGIKTQKNKGQFFLGYLGSIDNIDLINRQLTEHRIYQDYRYNFDFNFIQTQFRYRLEERFFTDNFKIRNRFSIQCSKNIFKNSSLSPKIIFNNEIFIQGIGFNQNRTRIELDLLLNKYIEITLGYQNQFTLNNNTNQVIFGVNLML